MSHADTRLTEYARHLAASRVAQGHKPGEGAKQLGVTVNKCRRLKEEGVAGLADRSSRPRTTVSRRVQWRLGTDASAADGAWW